MTRYLEFHFEDSESTTYLKYKLSENKHVANIFFDNIKSFLEKNPDSNCGYTASNGLRYSSEDLELLLNRLKSQILSVNQKAHIFALKKIDENLVNNISKFNLNKNLNLLHEDFEQIMSDLRQKYQKITNQIDYRDEYLKICESLNLINNTIHEIEGTFSNYTNFVKNKNYSGFYSACLLNENGWTGKRINLSKKDYDEFTLEQFFGQLSIGYDTLGKNLLQAYWTNDLKIIKEQKITPQTSFTTNVLLYFTSEFYTCESIYKGFSKWYDENDISQYGYSKNISDESLGNITIGELRYIDDLEIDLESLNFEDKLLIVDKIKNKTLKKYITLLL